MPSTATATREPFVEIAGGKIINLERGNSSTVLHIIIHGVQKIESLDAPSKTQALIYDKANDEDKKATSYKFVLKKGNVVKIYPTKGNQCQVVCYAGRNDVRLVKYSTWERKRYHRC